MKNKDLKFFCPFSVPKMSPSLNEQPKEIKIDIIHPFRRDLAPKNRATKWRSELVEIRLIDCLECVSKLPNSGRRTVISVWPQYGYDSEDMAAQAQGSDMEPIPEIRVPPTPVEIALMDESISWVMRYLKFDEDLSIAVGLFLRKKRENLSREAIEGLTGNSWSSYKINSKARKGLEIIAAGLNRDGVRVR